MSGETLDLAVVGGGAAGYFAALRAAALSPGARICIFENNRRPLEKVRISGGGRCNVTHNCFDPALLIQGYPRGSKELRSAFSRFQPQHMLTWLKERGVEVKAEDDGRMFPVSDQSSTIIDCFERERSSLGVNLLTESKVESVRKGTHGQFELDAAARGEATRRFTASTVLLATGNHVSGHKFARELGHTVTALVPSLFTFNVRDERLQELSGISVPNVRIDLIISGKKSAASSGPLLITHWGLSGPAVLKLSAWAAPEIYNAGYKAILRIHWSASHTSEEVRQELLRVQNESGRKSVLRSPQFSLPQRLWEYLLRKAAPELRERTWAEIGKSGIVKLTSLICSFELEFDGKGQFKEEFVTCGGVELSEIDFRSMQSKVTPGLYLAGEVLNIDGITGGFNFQSAWTCGWIAGSGIAERFSRSSSNKNME